MYFATAPIVLVVAEINPVFIVKFPYIYLTKRVILFLAKV